MSRRSFSTALVIVLASFVALAVVGVSLYRVAERYPELRRQGSGKTVELEIPRGVKFPEVAARLAAAGVIDRPNWFRLYAMQQGKANKVRAGRYELRDDMTPSEVLAKLVEGVKAVELIVTIPEGKHLREVCALLGEARIADAGELEAVARNPGWLKEHGLEGETADGYLFPDTYRFKPGTAAPKVLEAMVRRHREVYAELAKSHARELAALKKRLGWTDRDVVIMASIVEKETGVPTERPQVASVFFNRLTLPGFKSRRLETDPTIRYGCTIPATKSAACTSWDPAGRLYRKQLDDADNLYNTYQHAGLPPGPISNPGRAALEATMRPAQTEYLYFVAKDDRSHVFSKTYEEHTRWVDKYQR